MSLANMLTDTKEIVLSSGAAAAQTTITSAAIDMTGFDAVKFTVVLGTVSAGSVMGLQAQDCATTGGTYANCGAALSVTDAGGATTGESLILDVVWPGQRFVKLVMTRGTANAAVASIVAQLYRARVKPTAVDASCAGSLLTEATT